MSRFFAFLTLVAWSLWLGGLVTLFLCILTLFKHNHSLAAQSAPLLFVTFERYQLLLAAIVLTSTVAWRFTTKNLLINLLFLLLCLSSLGAIASPLYFTKQMEALRHQGDSSSPKFKTLHSQSMWVYTTQATLLLICGFPLFTALHKATPPPKSEP